MTRSKSLTQSDLEKKYVGPTFNLALAYASTTTYIAIAFLLSAGLPILIPIMCGMLWLRYTLDKLYVLKYYHSPPTYVLCTFVCVPPSRLLLAWLSRSCAPVFR